MVIKQERLDKLSDSTNMTMAAGLLATIESLDKEIEQQYTRSGEIEEKIELLKEDHNEYQENIRELMQIKSLLEQAELGLNDSNFDFVIHCEK